ncbi:DUF3313 domain-containing protein [Schauerella aestuarii]|uniref:DUF3313 domain-containing protein n=1 Tax=Schauerella aestuarii TaxID=2511204 RepID=UPI00136D99F2|nr:DUF3313 domain-containing protein [Achromobacter aestuarii]MYZ45633.1 DUF3313 domain-containing protein [Achromobacter aestuarii]
MNTSRLKVLSMSVAAVVLLASCASTAPPKESGFLPDYSKLQRADAPGGGTRLLYVNPAFVPANYDAIYLEPLRYYPTPQPSDKVSMQTLETLRVYADQSLRSKVGQRIRIVNAPGPRVARWQIAVTAVGADTEALKAYQYIPIGLAITGAMALAEGGRPQMASIAIENHVTDSTTNVLLFASVRGGTGEQIKSASQGAPTVQPDDLKPLIDQWTDAAAGEVAKYVKSK